MVLNVTENKQSVACSYTKTDRCVNEVGRSVNGQVCFFSLEGGPPPVVVVVVVVTHQAPM